MSSVVTPRIWVSPALEQGGAVGPRDQLDLDAQIADRVGGAAIDAEAVGEDHVAHDRLHQAVVRGGDLLATLRELRLEGGDDLVHEGVGGVVAVLLRRGLQQLRQLGRGLGLHGGVNVVVVGREQRELAHVLGGLGGQGLLRGAQVGDEWLGGLEALRDDGLRRRRAALGDQVGDVLGGAGLDHHEATLSAGPWPCRTYAALGGVVVGQAAGDDDLEQRLLVLLDGRERDPRALRVGVVGDQRHADGADRAGTGRRKLGGGGAALMARRTCPSIGDMMVMMIWTSLRRPFTNVGAADGRSGGSQDGVLAGAPHAAEERAGDAARGVHALLDIHRQREEVEALAGLLTRTSWRASWSRHRVRGDSAVGLSGSWPVSSGFRGAEVAVVDDSAELPRCRRSRCRRSRTECRSCGKNHVFRLVCPQGDRRCRPIVFISGHRETLPR